jgi:uncharacterized repeat protein (TIGR03803 family)
MYSVGGTLSGLASGESVVLQDSGGNNTTVSANGSFTFSQQVANNAAYAVTVLNQPTGQTCTVTSGSGSVSGANVTNVGVTCTINTYTISGTVSGLNTGAQVTVKNNAGDPTRVTANGSFSFATPVSYNGSYAVTVAIQPPAQACTVTAGTGSNVTGNVSGVSVACGPATESVIHTFDVNADGIGPAANVVQGSDGNFYGTTQRGGPSNLGTVFKITPAGVETVLHSFAGGASDGSLPTAALIQGSDGNFYGTTSGGGPAGAGNVFRITPAGVETVLHSFGGGTTDGSTPNAALILGSDGNFYGTTSKGGTSGNGTVFRITPAGVETVLYSFAGGTADGSTPNAALLLGSDGNFYGTTSHGGTGSNGTVFKTTPAGIETVLYSFAGGTTDGRTPNAALIPGSDGNFYGTTSDGGMSYLGTVFKITPAGVETVLYSFAGGTTDGRVPNAALILGSDGNFYGTTSGGGPTGAGIPFGTGTVFKITPAGVETVLHLFAGGATDGSIPNATLIPGSDGNFYGTTSSGGAGSSGSLVKITLAGTETVVYSFNTGPEGQNPVGLIQGGDGNFYGTTSKGGTKNLGTVFEITSAGVETMLYSFAGGTDGSSPSALIQGSDGNFYGTTSNGGTNGYGTVFKITPAGIETVLYSFAGGTTDGGFPAAALIQGSDGNFYGTTQAGGTSNSGTVFKVTPAGVETVLHFFAGGTSDGGFPTAALIQGGDGNFYGTTSGSGGGTVFKITPSGVETVLHTFLGAPADGSTPTAALVLASDGNFYGTTAGGGRNNAGTVFKITPGGVETVLHSFTGGTADGSSPNTALLQGNDGNFYGTTIYGGIGGDINSSSSGNGTLFRITAAAVETILYSFAGGADGSNPNAMIPGADGIFYGTTHSGGSSDLGTVYTF